MPAVIRHADPVRDAAACAAIYAPHVSGSAVSFEIEPPDAGVIAARIDRIGAEYPWLVLERDGELAGYAYACRHRERAAYDWVADVSVYVAAEHARRGFGRALYEALLELLRRQRLRIAVAVITLPNDASVALHRELGFAEVGVYRAVGFKLGRWHDVATYQLALAPPDAEPDEPLGPQRLPGGAIEL